VLLHGWVVEAGPCDPLAPESCRGRVAAAAAGAPIELHCAQGPICPHTKRNFCGTKCLQKIVRVRGIVFMQLNLLHCVDMCL
jgi:hypothetical protein